MTQMVEFRVAMMSTCTHKWSIFHCKAYRQMYTDSVSNIKVLTTKLQLSVDTISPIVNLHGRQRQSGKAD